MLDEADCADSCERPVELEKLVNEASEVKGI